MKVIVFDIDGTLTRTNRVDAACFETAILAHLPGLELEGFEGFVEMTDAAILREICGWRGTADYAALQERVLRSFVRALREALEIDPAGFSAVPGAHAVFDAARAVGWVPAIATGGWRSSAELKLDAARLPIRGVPLATSSEHEYRVDIIRSAVAQASGGAEVEDVVYVGDGIWDVRACRELGIGFIGRADPGSEDRLTAAGARAIIPDYSDAQALLGLLVEPALPGLAVGEV